MQFKWHVRKLPGNPSPTVGESRAALEGMVLALDQEWTSVQLEGDCKQVVAELCSGGDAIISNVRNYLHLFFFSCSFVKHLSNGLAHALTHISFFVILSTYIFIIRISRFVRLPLMRANNIFLNSFII